MRHRGRADLTGVEVRRVPGAGWSHLQHFTASAHGSHRATRIVIRLWKNERVKLLVAALESELIAFPEELSGFRRLVTGPGKLKATYALTRALDADVYDEILVVGTAGALDETVGSGVHEVHWAFQHDVINEDGVRGEHVSMPQRIALGDGDISIATGDSFIDDADAVQLIHSLGGRLVDMESYAYAWVAAQFDVPIRIWKAVSDNAQDGANTTWEEAVTACSHQLRDRVRAVYGV